MRRKSDTVAIVAGDTARVAALASRVNLNQPGHQGATYLTVSARELWRTTNQLEVLTLLLDRGAELRTRESEGHDVFWHAVTVRHWPAVLLLLQRGADWKSFRGAEGQSFREVLESQARTSGEGRGLAEVIDFVRTAETRLETSP